MSRFLAAGCIVTSLTVVDVAGDCYQPSLTSALKNENTAVMFSGVTAIVERVFAGQVITFDVDRVWKGNVSRSFVIYNYIRPPTITVIPAPAGGGIESGLVGGTTPGSMLFRPSTRYIVVAHRFTALERQQFGLADIESFGVGPCGDGTILHEVAERNGLVAPLGVGNEPSTSR
jgi:hypothetical protein